MKTPLFDLENWKEIWVTLSRNKTRTFLTGFGIFWGVAMLAMLVGGSKGAQGMLERNFAGFSTNSAALIPGNTTIPYAGFQKGRKWKMDTEDLKQIQLNFPEVEAIASYSAWGRSFKNGKHSYSGMLGGVEENYLTIYIPKIEEGRFINDADVAKGRHVAVIGKRVATQLYPEKTTPVGELIDVDGVSYRVVGLMDDASDVHINGPVSESVFIPSTTFRIVNGYANNVDYITMVGKGNTDMTEAVERIGRFIRRRHNIHPSDTGAIETINVAEMFQVVDKIFTGVDLLAIFIGFSTLLAGIIGIGNIMWVIVKERTQEIGIRRAIGANPSDIIVQVLCEGAVLTAIAGTSGLVFAVGILEVAHRVFNDGTEVLTAPFQMSFTAAMMILGVFLILGILASLIPSFKAMRIKPVEAINSK